MKIMDIGALCALLLVAAILAVTLREQRPETALCVALAAGAAVTVWLMSRLSEALAEWQTLARQTGMSGSTVTLLLRALGICLLVQITANTCRDAGQTGLASKAEFAGKIALLCLAMPLFRQLLELAVMLMDGGGT